MENEEYSRGNPGGLAYTGCWDGDSRQPTVLASCLGAAPDPEVTKLVTHPLCLWICTRPLCLSKLKSLACSSSQVLLAGVSLKGECLGCAADRFHREMLIWAALWADLVKQRLEWDHCYRIQIPCLCKASLLSAGLCVPFIFYALSFTLNFHLTHQVRSGRGRGGRNQDMAPAVECGVLWCDIHTFLWLSELAHLLCAIANSFVLLSTL